jgi:hypothetical protein
MRETESELRQQIEQLRDQFVKMSKSKAIVDPFTLINQAIDVRLLINILFINRMQPEAPLITHAASL